MMGFRRENCAVILSVNIQIDQDGKDHEKKKKTFIMNTNIQTHQWIIL